jgi:glucose-6-phosphate 1-dehydrogenase
MVSRIIPVDPFDLVIFGAPAIWRGARSCPGCTAVSLPARCPKEARIIGAARSDLDDSGYRDGARGDRAASSMTASLIKATIDAFLERIGFICRSMPRASRLGGAAAP